MMSTAMPKYMQTDNAKFEFKTLTFFQKAVETESDNGRFLGYIEGYASTTDIDRDNEMISESALQKAAQHLLENSSVFFNHAHSDLPIGVVLASKYVAGKGLYVKVGISKNHPQIWQAIEEGSLKSFSVAGRFTDWEEVEIVREGKKHQIFKINDLELWEVSVVGIPANPQAQFGISDAIYKYFTGTVSSDDELETKGKIMNEEHTETEDSTSSDVMNENFTLLMKRFEELATQNKVLVEKFEAEEKRKQEELAKAAAAEREEFEKWRAEQKRAEATSFKSAAKRETVIRNGDTQPVYKTAKQLFNEELGLFYKALAEPGNVDVDLYALPDYKPPNFSPYKREHQGFSLRGLV